MRILFLFIIFLTCIGFPGCYFLGTNKNTSTTSSPLVDLSDSVSIIRTLIAQNKIGPLLEEHDPYQLELLLNNVSPAQMAFEAEILTTIMPLVAVYYFTENNETRAFIEKLHELAAKYDNQIKFVIIDSEKLFSLAQDAELQHFPTILLVKNREIIERIEENITIDTLEQLLKSFI